SASRATRKPARSPAPWPGPSMLRRAPSAWADSRSFTGPISTQPSFTTFPAVPRPGSLPSTGAKPCARSRSTLSSPTMKEMNDMGLKVTETYYCDHCRRIVMEPKDLICIQVSKGLPFDANGVDDRFLAVCLACFYENSAADMIPDFDYRGIDHATKG